jgi:deazaflavin-dependent oxidoreductase (nitroreductase family)
MTSRLGSWNFKEKPTGLWRLVLHAPRYLFKWKLGWAMGDRFVMIDHVGRTSGRPYQTVVEVVGHDESAGEYVVCSGTGPEADWYRNIGATPTTHIQVSNRQWKPTQRLLEPDEAARRLAQYEDAHSKAAKRLLSSMGNSYDGTDAGRLAMIVDMPMVAFSDSAKA